MPLIKAADMPAPRLELRWQAIFDRRSKNQSVCYYNLVIPLKETDIRRATAGDNTLSINIGRTDSVGFLTDEIDLARGTINTPFRDGAHAMWDAKHLGNLPVYAVYGPWAMLVTEDCR